VTLPNTMQIDPKINVSTGLTPGFSGTQTGSSQLQGQFSGQQVVEQDIAGDVAKAAEEMSFAKAERSEKKLSERKSVPDPKTTHAVAQAELYMERMQEAENMDKASSFLQKLQSQKNPNPDDILKELKNTFKEPGEQHAALTFTRELLGEQPQWQELSKSLLEAQKKLESEFGTVEIAGVVRKVEDQTHARIDESTRAELHQFQQDTLLEKSNVLETYDTLVQRYGEKRFPEALSFLIRTTGNEMSSSQSSVPQEKVKTMVDDLFHVQVLGNLHSSIGNLSDKIESHFGERPKTSATEIMKALLSLTQNPYPRSEQVEAILRQTGLKDVEAQIYFLNALKEHARLIPLKAYQNPDSRLKLVDAIQQCLDQTIQKEEEAL